MPPPASLPSSSFFSKTDSEMEWEYNRWVSTEGLEWGKEEKSSRADFTDRASLFFLVFHRFKFVQIYSSLSMTNLIVESDGGSVTSSDSLLDANGE